MQCTGEARESLDLSLQGQGFLIVLVLDHSLRRLHHLSERDLPRVSQHHPEHIVVLPLKKRLVGVINMPKILKKSIFQS